MAKKIKNNNPLLTNLQANILKGHGRNFAHHLFFQLDEKKSVVARKWIAQFADNTITSAFKQVDDSDKHRKGELTDGGTVYTLSLSSTGYDNLKATAVKPGSNTFQQGMAANALLKDNIRIWDKAFKKPVDMLIIVADDNSKTAKSKADAIVAQTSGFATLVLDQRGNVLKTKSGFGIEHFGYADGISQPLFLESDPQASTNEWDDTTDTDLILVPDNTNTPKSFGSFLVFRKLEQNVKAFNKAEDKLPVIKDNSGNGNDELAGALIVGRFENSLPVILDSVGQQSNPPLVTNDFNYANDLTALKCPFHAHVRLMNPRRGDTVAGNVDAQRITRRGIPYDDAKRIPEDRITTITDDLLDKKQPTKDVGLLFMCYQSSIETQFEILQQFWANQGQILGHSIGVQDGLISQGTNPKRTLPKQWGQAAQTKPFSFDGFVKTKGGEYFFTPSIPLLKSL